MKKLCLSSALCLFSALVFVPKPAHAITVTAALCAVQEYPCLPLDIIDSGFRSNGVNLLPGNRYTLLNFNFSDAAISFT